MLEQTAEGIVQSSSLETAVLAPGFMPMELTSPRATLSSLLLGKLQGLACLLPWDHLCTSALAFYPISCWVPTWDLEMHKMQCLDLYFTLEAGSGHKVCKWGMVLSFLSSPSPLPWKSGFSSLIGIVQLKAGAQQQLAGLQVLGVQFATVICFGRVT